MSRAVRRFLALAWFLALCSEVDRAHADDDPQSRAQRLFEEGKKLLDESRFEAAIVVFQRVLAVYPSVGAYYNIGEAFERMDKPVAAWAAYADAASMAHAKLDARENDARAKMSELEPKLPRLVVRDAPADLKLTIKEPVPPGEWVGPLRRAPGEYELVARARCKLTFTTRVVVTEDGKGGDIVVGPLADDPACLPAPPDSGRGQRLVGYGVLGGGALGVAVGSVLGLVALSTKADLDRECGGDYLRCNATDRRRTDDINDRARTEASVSTIGFVAGGILLAAGATLVLTAPKRSARSAIVPSTSGAVVRF